MYGWIWKKIPGGFAGRLTGSLVLAAGVFALLWFVAFPAIRPLMPWSNVELGGGDSSTVEDEGTAPAEEEPTCTPGLDCADTNFNPEDYETPESPSPGEGDD